MFTDYEFFASLYGDVLETEYNRTVFEANMAMDNATTTVDGVHKLQAYPPVEEYTIDALKRCEAALTYTLIMIDRASVADNRRMVSVNSGSESISYANIPTVYESASADPQAKRKLINDTIATYLRGQGDANGINLLYGGIYPNV